jgi:putative ATPase
MEHQYVPLAEKLRPQTLKDIIGHEHLTGKDGLLTLLVKNDQPTSLILWGPPGSGKTTIARILKDAWGGENKAVDFVELSAVTSGVKDIRAVIERAEQNRRLGQQTVLFVDEVHRFNKSQQDAFLPHIESGVITLIGATTENPSFEVNNALLSRTKVIVLHALDAKALKTLITKAAKAVNRKISPKALTLLANLSGGDGRTAINTIEVAAQLVKASQEISSDDIKTVLQRTNYQFDKSGDEHYNLASAFIKSMRGSNVEASMYYLHRLIVGGEDPLFIARRMVIFASEDIGMAAPYALTLVVAAFQAVEKVGLPEAEYTLSHTCIALAKSPKSREVADIMARAKQQVAENPNAAVPLHLRNAPTKLMKDLDYGKDYKWKADFKPDEGFLPKNVA